VSGRDEVRTFGAWWRLEMFKMFKMVKMLSQIANQHVGTKP
jgi:hypothetical protein